MWTPGDQVTFAVDPVGVRVPDLYMLWVANVCTQDGVTTYAGYLPVTYSSYHAWGRPIRSSFQVMVGRAAPLSARLSCGGCRTPHASRRRVAKPGSVVREAPTDAGPTAKTPSACVYDS